MKVVKTIGVSILTLIVAAGLLRGLGTVVPAGKDSQRTPAKALLQDPVNLRSLYPELTDEAFRKKLQKASSELKFFRSFAPLYYRQFFLERKSFRPSLEKVANFTGWCAGDAHPENFGVLINQNEEPVFSVVDPDDSGPCTLVADWMRFLMVARRSLSDGEGIERSISRVFDAYFDGLQGKVKLSRPVREILDRAKNEIFFDEDLRVFDDKIELTTPVAAQELLELKRIFAANYGSVSKIEANRYAKLGGGSAGLLRYLVRAQIKGKSVTVELKTVSRPAVFFEREEVGAPNSHPEMAESIRRMRRALELLSPQGRSEHFRVVEVLGAPMVFSPRYQGMRSIELDRDGAGLDEDVLRILRDEAAVLGELHARTSSKPAEYLAALKEVTVEEWDSLDKAIWGSMMKVWAKGQ